MPINWACRVGLAAAALLAAVLALTPTADHREAAVAQTVVPGGVVALERPHRGPPGRHRSQPTRPEKWRRLVPSTTATPKPTACGRGRSRSPTSTMTATAASSPPRPATAGSSPSKPTPERTPPPAHPAPASTNPWHQQHSRTIRMTPSHTKRRLGPGPGRLIPGARRTEPAPRSRSPRSGSYEAALLV